MTQIAVEFKKNIKVGILFYYKVVSNIKSYRGDLDNE